MPMPKPRQLRPAEPSVSQLPSLVNHGQPDIRQKRKHHSREEWEHRKELVFKYYCKEGLSLEKTMAKIEETGLIAGKRTWKNMIKTWGFEKNIPGSAKQKMLQKKKERSMKGKGTTFIWRGNEVAEKRLEQFEKRQDGKPMDYSMLNADTPEELQYFTPRNGLNMSTDCDMNMPINIPTDGEGDSSIQLMSEQAEKIVDFVIIEQKFALERRYTEKGRLLEIRDHHHQMGFQRLRCSGYFSENTSPHNWLFQARNLAIYLNEAIHGLQQTVHNEEKYAFAEGPEYFLLKGDNQSNTQEESIFMECVKKHIICSSLFGLDELSPHQWKQGWRSMDKQTASCLDKLARHIFGDLQVPYPNMSVSYFLVRFSSGSSPDDCKLLRITLGIDRRPEIQECQYCEPVFVALEYISPKGALSVHIPLTHAGNEHQFETEKDYSSCFHTKAGTISSSLISLAASYQGWSYETRCYGDNIHFCCFKKDVEEWDPYGSIEQDRPFQPFPPDQEIHICSNLSRFNHILGGNQVDEDCMSDSVLDFFEP